MSREKVGRAYRYMATMSQEDYTANKLKEVLVDSPDRGAALLTFVGRLSEAEQVKLRAALAKLEAESPGEEKCV